MSNQSTYVERLQSELVAAGRRLQKQRRREAARERRATAGRTRLQAKLALGGAGGVALVAVLVLTVFDLGAGTQRAYAGWTPMPTQPASGQLAAAEAACVNGSLRKDLERMQAIREGRGGTPERGAAAPAGGGGQSPAWEQQSPAPERRSPPMPTIAPGEWQRTLSDTRGPYTMLIFQTAAGQAQGFCLSRGSTLLDANESYDTRATTVPAGQVHVYLMGEAGQGGDPGEEPYSYVNGQTGAGVTAVTLDLESGEQIQASVENGWFLAWWPGSARASEAAVSTANGTSSQSLGG